MNISSEELQIDMVLEMEIEAYGVVRMNCCYRDSGAPKCQQLVRSVHGIVAYAIQGNRYVERFGRRMTENDQEENIRTAKAKRRHSYSK